MPHKKSRSKSPLPNLLQDLVMLHLRPSYFPRSLFLQSYHQTSQKKKKHRFLRKDSRNAEKSRISIETRALSNDDKTNPQKDLRDKEQHRIKIRKGGIQYNVPYKSNCWVRFEERKFTKNQKQSQINSRAYEWNGTNESNNKEKKNVSSHRKRRFLDPTNQQKVKSREKSCFRKTFNGKIIRFEELNPPQTLRE